MPTQEPTQVPANDEFQSLWDRAGSSAGASGKYEAQLKPSHIQLLDEFVDWLRKSDNKKDSTSNSYRSYVAKAIALPEAKLTSDQKSATKAFARFMSQRTSK